MYKKLKSPYISDELANSSIGNTIDQLQAAVESGIWKGRPLLRNQLFKRYLELSSGQKTTSFGTIEFWNEIFEDYQLNDEDDAQPPNISPDSEDESTGNENSVEKSFEIDESNQMQQRGYGDESSAENEKRPQQQQITITPSDYYELKVQFKKSNKRFGADYGQYDLFFKNMENVGDDIEVVLLAVFMEILETLKSEGRKDDLMSFFLDHPALDIPIALYLRPQSEMTAELIADAICNVLQSKKEMTFDEHMTVFFTRVKRLAGKGWTEKKYTTNISEYLKKKKAIIQIVNDDRLCCARAIVVDRARVDKDPKYNTIRQGDRNNTHEQRRLADQLMEKAGLGNHQGACGEEEWLALQQALGHGKYQLKIFDKDLFGGLVYAGPEAPKILHLWLHDHHFDVITSMAAFFEKSHYCEHCDKAYHKQIEHRICPVRCNACCSHGRCISNFPMKKCNECQRFFYNEHCFENHLRVRIAKNKQKIVPICNVLHRCDDCNKEYYTREGHRCGMQKCPICKIETVMNGHQCFIQPYSMKSSKNRENEDPLAEQQEINDDEIEEEAASESTDQIPHKRQRTTFIFYDFESRQDESVGETDSGNINVHQANLVIAHKVCEQCCEQEMLGQCNYCRENRKVFEGDDCVDEFCEWLFSKQNKNSIAIAHNACGYDSQFILGYCHRQGIKPKQIISRGLGIMYMEVGAIKFKDSLNFLPMPLAALPKCFDVQECKKGYFPHLFNRRENWNYDGDWPAVHYYQPQYMKDSDRTKFLEWYELQREKKFNFQKEIKEYCESDVEVLRKCCLKFRRLFLEIGQLDPFVESITIASVCNKYYRMHHLPINRIAVIPHGGYRKEEKQSIIALKWLKWIAHKTGRRIQHKLNGGEVKIDKYKVDGLSDKTVYEFYGCFWHGCSICMQKRKRTTADGILTADEAYQRTMDRRKVIESLGYTVVEKWECELRRELKQDSEMADFFNNVQIIEPLDAREAFFGGRTNATVLHRKVAEGEQIKYIDILSLYPSICKYGRFPTGHPKIITENFEPMDAQNMPYEGLVKCKVLPPRRLLHPLLPFRCNKKLMFPLCATCASSKQQEQCQHSDEERALTGAWVTLELKKALELGYKILEVYEVWHFEEYEQYDPTSKTGGLFTEYINDFLRIKQESDGFPEDADTMEKKQAFIEMWHQREGILLRLEKMIKNPGLRALAKLMLNSFWGKFGQRSKMPKMEYFTDQQHIFVWFLIRAFVQKMCELLMTKWLL